MCLSTRMRSPRPPRVAKPRTVSIHMAYSFPSQDRPQPWRTVGRPDLTLRPLSDTGKRKPSPRTYTRHEPLRRHPPLHLAAPALAGDPLGNDTDALATKTAGTEGGACSGRLWNPPAVGSRTCERP